MRSTSSLPLGSNQVICMWNKNPHSLFYSSRITVLSEKLHQKITSLFGTHHQATPPRWHGIFSYINKLELEGGLDENSTHAKSYV